MLEEFLFWVVALIPIWVTIGVKVFPERTSEAIDARRVYNGSGAMSWRDAVVGFGLLLGTPIMLVAVYIKLIE